MDSFAIYVDMMIVRENTAYRIVRKLKKAKNKIHKKRRKKHKIHLPNVISVAIVAA